LAKSRISISQRITGSILFFWVLQPVNPSDSGDHQGERPSAASGQQIKRKAFKADVTVNSDVINCPDDRKSCLSHVIYIYWQQCKMRKKSRSLASCSPPSPLYLCWYFLDFLALAWHKCKICNLCVRHKVQRRQLEPKTTKALFFSLSFILSLYLCLCLSLSCHSMRHTSVAEALATAPTMAPAYLSCARSCDSVKNCSATTTTRITRTTRTTTTTLLDEASFDSDKPVPWPLIPSVHSSSSQAT